VGLGIGNPPNLRIVDLLIRRWLWGHQAPWFGQLMPHSGGSSFQTIAPNGKGMNAGREGKVSIEGFLEICIGSSSSSQPRKNWTRMVPLSPKHRFTDGGESWKNRSTSFKYWIPGSLLALPLRLRCSARAHSTLGARDTSASGNHPFTDYYASPACHFPQRSPLIAVSSYTKHLCANILILGRLS